MTEDGHWLNLDRFVDIAGLQQLDDEVRQGIIALRNQFGVNDGMLGGRINRFFPSLPDLRYDRTAPTLSKLKTINLRLPRGYTSIHLENGAESTEMSACFPGLVAWARTLPFEQFGRFFIIFDQESSHEPIHRGPVPYQEFLWLRTNPDKAFFVFDPKSNTKHYFRGNAVWFNQHAYHGCDEAPPGQLQWSIRIDGVFSPEVRAYVREHFRAWTEEQRALVARFETGKDLDDLFPALSGSPERFKTLVNQLREQRG